MHKSVIIFFSLLIILVPVGSSLNISNATAIADYDKEQSKMDLDLSNDHYYVFPQNNNLLQKIKCNNINVNVNGLELDVFPHFLSEDIATEAQDTNTDASSFAGNNGDGSTINDFEFICINNNNNTATNNNNTNIGNGNISIPPAEEFANLNVIKNVDCISEGGTPDDDAVCDYVLENILPSNYQMIVTGIEANSIPSEFPGSSTGTSVQLGAGVEGYILTEELANTEQLEADLEASVLFTSTSVDPGSDCVAFIDQEGVFQNANASISAGQSQTCSITNTISVGGGTVPTLAQNTQDSAELTALEKQPEGSEALTVMEKLTKLKTQWLSQLP